MTGTLVRVVCLALLVVAGLTARPDAQGHAWPASSVVTQTGYVKASTPGEMEQFGSAVALSADGNTLAVGAPSDNSGARGINGNEADDSLFAAGAVYVYVRDGGAWAREAYIKASNPGQNDQFGAVLALSADGHTLAVGAQFEDGGATGTNGNQADESVAEAGAAYVFTRSAGVWSQQAYIKASNTGGAEDGDTFGFSLALSDDGHTLAVGAPSEDSHASGVNGSQQDNSAASAGAVYVFTRAGGTWSQQAYIKSDAPPPLTAGDLFGYAVGLSADGSTLGIGVYDEAGSSNVINGPIDGQAGGSGAVYVFTRHGATWSREAYLKASTPDRGDSLGAWVAVSDDGQTLAAGALDEDTPATGIDTVKSGNSELDLSSGAAYVFTRTGTTWSQQASFKASNTGKEDWFGVRLALSGDGNTFAVAAPNEDSGARGIDGNQADDGAPEAGAVYLFTRRGGMWRQTAYVKASNTEEFDEFGSAIALDGSGRLMAVGARYEDGGANTAAGDELHDSVPDSGAVYLFVHRP